MRRVISIFILGVFLLGNASPSFAGATSVDALIRKLVDKKILSKEEALELKSEIAADEKMVRAEGLKTDLPSWVKDMKLKGDLRVRYQNERRDSTQSRNRGRIRMRLGLETKANDKVQLGVGIATGSGDPRSTNETSENSFEKMDLRLDYAYAKYMPTTWASITGGKMLSPFWTPKDLLVDSDISYDGGSVNLTSKKFLNDQVDFFLNTGFFIMDEGNGASTLTTENFDPYLYVIQPGLNIKPTANTKLKLAATYFGIDNIRGQRRLQYSASTNTTRACTDASGAAQSCYAHDFEPVSGGMEFTIDSPFGNNGFFNDIGFDQIAFLGEYVKNVADMVDEHNDGYLLGARIGAKKVSGPRQWQLGYNFRRLERNAFLDNLPDSDFYGGGTHVQGHEVEFAYGLSKNVSLNLDYYRAAPIGGEEIDTRQAKVENIIQADLNFKF
ncbi:MAG: putative porin [Candidatus Omnitrophota bacterium]